MFWIILIITTVKPCYKILEKRGLSIYVHMYIYTYVYIL